MRGPSALAGGGGAGGRHEAGGAGDFAGEVAGVKGNAPDGLVHPAQLRDGELGRAESGRQRRVFELGAGTLDTVAQDAAVVEGQFLRVGEHVLGRGPACGRGV